jgi:acetyl-CoA acetyltransferase family protein
MRVAIVGGVRTPFVKASGVFSQYSTLELGRHVVVGCIEKLGLDAATIDDLYFGTVLLDPRVPNLAREVILRSGLPKSINGHFVSNNCITGLVAASLAHDAIAHGRIRSALVGGAESMSQPTLTFPRAAERFFIELSRCRTLRDKLSVIRRFRPGFLAPQAPSPKEPSTGLTMGQHCELMAQEFGISRIDQDRVALRSHQRAAEAQAQGIFSEQILEFAGVRADNLIRGDSSAEKLASLPAVFDRSAKGSISAGNSSALTDGASAVCLMSEEQARQEGRTVLGYLEGVGFASLVPGDGLLMAPVLAVPRLLKALKLTPHEIDLYEIHEAFAAQVLCTLKAWEAGWDRYPNEPKMHQFEAVKGALGVIPEEKINVLGGSIALGHPFAATGGRLLLNACHALRARGKRRCAISVCAAGGGGAAAVVSVD